MDVSLSVEGTGSRDELAELEDWLRQEPELRGLVTRPSSSPSPHELGTTTDALAIAVGSGGAISVLAASLKVFLAQPRRSDVTITVRTPDGGSVIVDAKRVADVEGLVRNMIGRNGLE